MKRKYIFLFTWIALFVSISINALYPLAGLWMLFLIPAFGFVTLFPKWITSTIAALLLPCIRVIIFWFIFDGEIPPDYFQRLVFTSLAAWLIILIFTYYHIQLTKTLERLNALSITDSLTRAYNRRYLELYYEEASLDSRCLAVTGFAILDIDYFKRINDTYGHSAGDFVLKKVTELIQGELIADEILVRLGGEEFAIILPNSTQDESLAKMKTIREKIEFTPFILGKDSIRTSISIGLTQCTTEPLDSLLQRADHGLYLAKANGRNTIVVV
ncbi:MAG: putative sensory transduction protein [Paenibacillus sp.]|nr:putative sensory transduction protein [Paenibacillus sp.]